MKTDNIHGFTVGPAKIGTNKIAITRISTGRVVRSFNASDAYTNCQQALEWLKENKKGAPIYVSDSEPKFSQYVIDHPGNGYYDKATSKRINAAAQKIEAIKYLQTIVKPGQTVSVSLVSVARSGLSRRVKLFYTVKGQNLNITACAATILGWHYDGDSVRVDGCGTDAAFQVVYHLSSALYPKGAKVPASYRGKKDASGFVRDGGYVLLNRWL